MKQIWSGFLLIILLIGCQSASNKQENMDLSSIDIQGHRGARGLLPENSIRGFLHAVDLGVNTLEMDLCVTKDKQIVVSHEPFFSSEICLDENRSMISEEEAKMLNIYEMNYEEVLQYDCGSLMHPRFPSQGKVKVVKPLLNDVFRRIEQYTRLNNLPQQNYNIELKSLEENDNLYQPEPAEFSDLVYDLIDQNSGIAWDRITIQSFDFRILQYFRKQYPNVRLSQLIENELTWQENVETLGFKPEVYSCYYKFLTKEIVEELHEAGIKVIPWTINEVEEMKELITWGVDGIITDYPDRVKEL
ncbi:MAG: glycerophosphodiester phosphodiesterase family protein [Cytophagales bacterium]|nr:glycerophosphodiester phosphodiesterase family protein [Cytophagales bacterium]